MRYVTTLNSVAAPLRSKLLTENDQLLQRAEAKRTRSLSRAYNETIAASPDALAPGSVDISLNRQMSTTRVSAAGEPDQERNETRLKAKDRLSRK